MGARGTFGILGGREDPGSQHLRSRVGLQHDEEETRNLFDRTPSHSTALKNNFRGGARVRI